MSLVELIQALTFYSSVDVYTAVLNAFTTIYPCVALLCASGMSKAGFLGQLLLVYCHCISRDKESSLYVIVLLLSL